MLPRRGPGCPRPGGARGDLTPAHSAGCRRVPARRSRLPHPVHARLQGVFDLRVDARDLARVQPAPMYDERVVPPPRLDLLDRPVVVVLRVMAESVGVDDEHAWTV